MSDPPEGVVGRRIKISAGLHVTLRTGPHFLDILRSCTVPDKRADQKLVVIRIELLSLSVA